MGPTYDTVSDDSILVYRYRPQTPPLQGLEDGELLDLAKVGFEGMNCPLLY